MPIYNNIESTDKAGVGFTKSNNAIDKIVTGGSVTNGVLTLDYNDLSTLDIALPVVSSGVSILTQNGSVDITGADPNCFIDVPALEYSYNGNVQAILSTQFAFVAPDPTNDRLDVISLDPVTNSYIYTQGTPAITPTLPTLGAGEVTISVLYVYGMQPCENSKVVYSAISEQMAEIIIDLTVQLEGVGVVTDSRLAPWDVALQYFLGDVCQIDGTFYKALQNNLGADPTLGSPDWVEIESGGAFVYEGVAYVDGSATPATGVFGDISKPFTDLTEAINAIPINTPTTVKCLDATPSWGAGGIDMSDKSIYIDAKGKDLTSTVSVFLFSTDSYLTIDCKNFTDSSTFSSGLTVLNIYAEETFTNSVSRIQEAGILTVTAKHLVSSIALSKTNLTLIVETGEITAELTWDTSFLRLHASELMTFSAGGILLNNPITGSVISGNYLLTGSARFMDRGTGVLLKGCNVTQGDAFMFTGGQVDCTIQGGYYECVRPLFGWNTSTGFHGKVTKAHFVMTNVGAQPTNFIFQCEGVTRIVDAIFESTLTSSVNGLSINSGVATISESTFILGDTTDQGVILNGGAIVDLGDNDQFPRATKVLDGTEIVKLKVGDGDYQETTTQAIADLGGGGGGGAKYVADWNVANATSGSAVSGSAYAVLVVPENDVTVTEMETFLTAGAVTTAYVGVYDQAGTTLLGESAIDCNGTGLRSNTLVGGGSFNLVGGTPYWFVLLEGAGAANFASNSALGNVLVAKSGFVSATPTGLPASIAGFTVATSSMYIGAKA